MKTKHKTCLCGDCLNEMLRYAPLQGELTRIFFFESRCCTVAVIVFLKIVECWNCCSDEQYGIQAYCL